MKNNKKQIGKDRLFQAAFLYHLYPNEDLILIDAGTFITIDFINKNGFLGGYIFQGLKTFLAGYKKGARLPELNVAEISLDHFHDKSIPISTKEAILGACTHYIKGIVETIKLHLKNKKIIITGGEAKYFSAQISSAQVINHLIHYSLYYLYGEINLIKEKQ